MEINWVGRGLVIAGFGDRTIRVGGEYLLNHEPDFLIYARSVTCWDDGTVVSEPERDELLDEVVAAASRNGWRFDISWEEFNLAEAIERYRMQEEAEDRPPSHEPAAGET